MASDGWMDKESNLFERGEDGWDRASIQLKTHPLHPFPDVQPADLIVSTAANKVRLAVDCVAVGLGMALFSFFPLLLFALTQTRDLSTVIYGTMTVVGGGTAVLLFIVAVTEERRFRAGL
ncbi:MAG TPA: hypothetical protein VFL41_06240 [Gaiellaceae bacterium]|nr:hypothetical protein [Gaiellaceae bacterium]